MKWASGQTLCQKLLNELTLKCVKSRYQMSTQNMVFIRNDRTNMKVIRTPPPIKQLKLVQKVESKSGLCGKQWKMDSSELSGKDFLG